MKIEHKEIKATGLKYDKKIFGGSLGDIDIDIKDQYAFAPIVETYKNKSLPFAGIGIEWHYIFLLKDKEVFHMVAEDMYKAEISDLTDIDEKIELLIQDSHNRFSETFKNEIMPPLVIGTPMSDLPKSEAISLRNALISLLLGKLK